MYGDQDPKTANVVPIPTQIIRRGPHAMIAFLDRTIGKRDEGQILMEWVRYDDGTLELQANYLNATIWEVEHIKTN